MGDDGDAVDPGTAGDDGSNGEDGGMDRIEALVSALGLKDETRTGWQLRGVADPESVAGHAWGVALCCLLYGDRERIDIDRALRLAIVHDLAEAETGDVATRVDPEAQAIDPETKARRERAAMVDFAAKFDYGTETDDEISARLLADWDEYEERESPEAIFVKDMDLVDMCAQALRYEREGRYEENEENDHFEEFDRLDEFFATARPRLRTETGRELFRELERRYERAKGTRCSERD